MSLKEKLAAMKANFEANRIPPEIVVKMHKATRDLIESGQVGRALKAGDRIPDFTLPDADGHSVSSAELLAKGPLVITFYRGVWCPYCNADLQAIEALAGELSKQGVSLVAISPQTPANSRKAQRDNKLSFPILSDKGNEVAHAFGLRFNLPAELIEVYKGFGNDLAVVNGEPSWTLPIPGRYVVGSDGVIAYAEVNPDYTTRPEPSDLLPSIAQVKRQSAA